jgi:UDP-N-acetylmuramate--alanine ligase
VIDDVALPGDVVVCLGAGNITAWALALPADLAAITAKKSGAKA